MYFRGGEMSIVNGEIEIIDKEWLELILEAKNLGLSLEEVSNFLNGNNQKEQQCNTYQNQKASYK